MTLFLKQVTILVLLFCSIESVYSQRTLCLESMKGKHRLIRLKQGKNYSIATRKMNFIDFRIIDFTDSTLRIIHDETITLSYDTVTIAFRNINLIENYWMSNQRNLFAPYTFLGMALVGGTLSAIDLLIRGEIESLKDDAIFAGGISIICSSIIYVGKRKTKYDLQNKWKIVVK